MYKLLSFLVLVALAVCVFATEQDQEAAEQYFLRYGYYPSWYSGYYGAVRSYPYATAYSGYSGYPYAYGAYGYNYIY